MTETLLHGVRVLELSATPAGRLAGMILADAGADVVTASTAGTGPQPSDRGKRVIDIALPQGRDVLVRMASRADVLLTSLDGDALRDLGLDHHRPDQIVCSLTPFGLSGALAHTPAVDLTLQAWSGVLDLTGHEGQDPIPVAFPIGDLAGAVYAAIAVVAETIAVEAGTSAGRLIDLSQHDCLLQLLGYTAQQYLLTHETPGRVGSGHHSIAPYEAFRLGDRFLAICAFSQPIWLRLLKALGAEELADDPRFGDLASRKLHHIELRASIEELLTRLKLEDWLEVLTDHDVASATVLTLDEAIRSAFVDERGLVAPLAGGAHLTVLAPIVADGVRLPADGPVAARLSHDTN